MSNIKTSNEEGYVLAFVIIITSILLLLGFTSLTLTQDNFKMKNVNSISQKNFYIAEALSQEVDVKLDELLDKSLEICYKQLSNYIEENNYDQALDEVLINKKFQELYKEQVHIVKNKIENSSDYNLKIIEKHDISVEAKLEENLEIQGFNIYVVSIFENRNIIEKIRTEYTIESPKYNDSIHNKDLLKKIGWVNSKW